MMYDFHYPLGQGKLNEDTANCRAKQYGMGKNAGPASLSLTHSLSLYELCWKKNGGPVAVAGLRSPSPPYLSGRRSSPTVHKSGAAYSRNYPESSTCNKLSDRFHPDYITLSVQSCFSALLPFLLHLCSVSRSLCLSATSWTSLKSKSTVGIKTKAGIITRSPSLPSVGGRGYKPSWIRKVFPEGVPVVEANV